MCQPQVSFVGPSSELSLDDPSDQSMLHGRFQGCKAGFSKLSGQHQHAMPATLRVTEVCLAACATTISRFQRWSSPKEDPLC